MTLSPPQRSALSDTVADKLRAAILDGSLKPGQPLHETALAQQMAVSRSPIREALIQLQRERLVVGRVNHPTVVRSPTPTEIYEIYTKRAALEGIAARWAAERASTTVSQQLRRKADDLNGATPRGGKRLDTRLAKLGFDFHAAISAAAASAELELLLQSLRNQIRLVMTAGLATMSDDRADVIHAEHIAIVEAIAARDGDTAEHLAASHVRGARDRLTLENVDGPAAND